MLDTLNGTGLDNVCVVVTRYFGGVLLGTGGLVRAYSDTVTATFDNSPRVRIVTQGIYGLDFDYATAPRAEAGLRAAGWNVTEVVWDAFARVHVAIDETRLKELAAVASQLSGHTCKPIFLEYRTVDVPLA